MQLVFLVLLCLTVTQILVIFMLMTKQNIALPLAGHGVIITYALAHIIDIHGTLKLGVGTRTGTKDFKCCPAQRIPAEHSFCHDYICT